MPAIGSSAAWRPPTVGAGHARDWIIGRMAASYINRSLRWLARV